MTLLSELSAAQWLVLAVAAFMYGFNKTGIVGSAVITTPLLLLLFTPGMVLGITLPILIAADLGTLLMLRRSANRRHVLAALPWAFLGIVTGWGFARYAVSLPGGGDALLRGTIAVALIFIIVFGVLVKAFPGIARRGDGEEGPETPGGRPRARGWFAPVMGVLGGVTTMLANNGGPAWVVYLTNLGMPPREFLGTAAWLFFCQNLVKVPFGVSLGFVTFDTAALVPFLLPPVVLGLLLGAKAVRRLPERLFNNITQFAALACAVYILVS